MFDRYIRQRNVLIIKKTVLVIIMIMINYKKVVQNVYECLDD